MSETGVNLFDYVNSKEVPEQEFYLGRIKFLHVEMPYYYYYNGFILPL